MVERWKDIVGFVGIYQVSDLGRVRSLDRVATRGKVKQPLRGKILSTKVSCNRKQPYLTVVLCRNGRESTAYVHRLVARAFIPNPCRLREVNHKDTDKLNCKVGNLEWSSSSDNKKHAVANGVKFNPHPRRGVQLTFAKMNPRRVRKARQLCANGGKQRAVAKQFDISQASLSDILLRKTWAHVK